MRVKHVFKASVAAAATALVLVAGAAHAAPAPAPGTIFVSHAATPSGTNKDCGSASFSSVQAAIDAVKDGGRVYLCGTAPFVESVAIQDKSVKLTGDPGAALQAPANAGAPTDFFSSQGLATPNAVVTVLGSSNAKIDGLTVEGPFANADCTGDDFGVLQVGGQLTLVNDRVLNVEAADQGSLGGCQYGVGIQVGRQHWPTTGGGSSAVDFVGNAKVQDTTVSGYQKNGITADGVSTTIAVVSSTVDGGGQTPVIARNGIQISRGATGQVHGDTVENNEYTGPGSFASATGVLVFGGCGDPLSADAVINDNAISNNDAGVVLANYNADCTASATSATDNRVRSNTISKSDGQTNQSPTTDQANNSYPGYQVGIGVTGDGDRIVGNTITGTIVGGTDTAYGPQHQAGRPFLDCLDLITYPPVGAKVSQNTCDGSPNYPVMPKAPAFFSGDNGDAGSSGSAGESGGAAVLTSSGVGFGVVSAAFPAGTTFSQLASLQTNYDLTQGACGGGSPRYQIDLQPQGDTNAADGVSLYLYFGTPPFGGCSSGANTEGEVIGGTTPQWFVFGGGFDSNTPMTYSQVRSTFGGYQLLDAQIAADGGWSQGGTQQVRVTNWEINGEVFFPN
ncbi:MAG TPA: hypothetical protein VJ814_02045 [Gaiellaceae bacterium]|nr:hypothetical protein [Gaiellaceae bacterium]